MKLTQKLLALLHRVFDPDPERFLALRIAYAGRVMSWSVSDAVLTTRVTGVTGMDLRIDLTSYTLRQLVSFIAAQPGYSVPGAGSGELMSLSARVLIDATGRTDESNGDHLYGYTSLTWAYMDSVAVELRAAKAQIPEALKQMVITTAADSWIDELGEFYNVKRQPGENDSSYGPRIIAETVRPRSNNVAMEKAISYYTGQTTKITDVIIYGDAFPLYDGAIRRNSEYRYQASARPRYCLFDVQYGYDLLSGSDPTEFSLRVQSIINRIRAAGTHLRALSLQSGSISDSFTPPADGELRLNVKPGLVDQFSRPNDVMDTVAALTTLNDALSSPMDSTGMTINYGYAYNSIRRRDSKIRYMGGRSVTE
uniref:Uncharacterized protein n=1 Tax=Pseudomonas phage Touem01 TaxID=3138548 RepID=A0AAU6W288_9VIRU